MKKELFDQILIRYQEGKANPDEIKFIESYYRALEYRTDPNQIGNQLPSAKTWNEIHEYINSAIQGKKAPNIFKLWRLIAVSAAAVTFLTIGIYFFIAPETPNENNDNIYLADIAPGKQGATLTLANGTKIKLSEASNGKLTKQANVTVSKLSDGQLIYVFKSNNHGKDSAEVINTLTTDKGETYQVLLPDGSQVWLNAASSLTYPVNLNEHTKRSIKLDGEAYFEVSKDKRHPFVVVTNNQKVEVLGTHFNINAYSDEPTTKTSLLEGSVKVNDKTILKPGEQSIMEDEKIAITTFDPDKVIAWKNGKFVFDEENIQSIMRKLSRWYNVEVSYRGELKDRNFTASISRFDKISKILDKLSYTNKIHFKIEEGRIIVMK